MDPKNLFRGESMGYLCLPGGSFFVILLCKYRKFEYAREGGVFRPLSWSTHASSPVYTATLINYYYWLISHYNATVLTWLYGAVWWHLCSGKQVAPFNTAPINRSITFPPRTAAIAIETIAGGGRSFGDFGALWDTDHRFGQYGNVASNSTSKVTIAQLSRKFSL